MSDLFDFGYEFAAAHSNRHFAGVSYCVTFSAHSRYVVPIDRTVFVDRRKRKERPAGSARVGCLGATGHISGTTISTHQFVGWRFQIDSLLEVNHVGGHLFGDPFAHGNIFAALIALDSLSSAPHGAPFDSGELIDETVFQPSFPSAEMTIPFTATSHPGSYALIFGTGMFGATGEGAMPNFDDQPDIPPSDISSYIFWGVPRPNAPFEWRTNLASHMRFIVEGTSVPEPATMYLLLASLVIFSPYIGIIRSDCFGP